MCRDMPSNARSKTWAFRVTAPWEHCELKVRKLPEWIDYSRHCVGYHKGDKTGLEHIHVVCELKSELQKQSFDVRVKKLFGIEGGNKTYSSKIWDGKLEAISYLYHDRHGRVDIDPMGFSESEIQQIQTLDRVYTQIVEENKTRASGKCVDRILEEIQDSGKQWSIREIARRILVGVRKMEWHAPGQFQMEKLVDEINLRQGSDDNFDENVAFYLDRFMQKYRY